MKKILLIVFLILVMVIPIKKDNILNNTKINNTFYIGKRNILNRFVNSNKFVHNQISEKISFTKQFHIDIGTAIIGSLLLSITYLCFTYEESNLQAKMIGMVFGYGGLNLVVKSIRF